MRKQLEKYDNQTLEVCGILKVKREQQIKGEMKDLYIFVDVHTTDGEFLTKHVCILPSRKMKRLNLKEGMKVTFNATVRKYSKLCEEAKYHRSKIRYNICDYGLSDVTHTRIC